MNPAAHCHTIAAEQPFLNVLAGWILEYYGHDTAIFTKTLILMPNRRACRALRDAFLEITGGKPLLLPRIRPLGDGDEPLAAFYETGSELPPPAMDPLRRELQLARLVMGFQRKQHDHVGRSEHVGQAALLARQLAQLMDDMAREGVSFNRLSSLVPEELAAHWQQTLDFLQLVSHHWPAIMEEEGTIGPVDHRNRLLKATADHWQKHPPSYPIIAAGSTGSLPATAALLKVIARLPHGMVVLPGLDLDMTEAEWGMVTETHPQFGLRQLLETMECARRDVTPLVAAPPHSARLACVRAILSPPEATAGWKQLKLPLEEGLKGMRLATAETLQDEARMITVALREILETPEKTAALVTPDRRLARMVASGMERFGIAIDDSAGRPLKDTPPGCFLRLAVEMAASSAAPAPLLALLRHPLAAAGMEPARCRQLSRRLEISLLRGIRRAPGIDTLADAARDPELKELLSRLSEHVRELAECFAQKAVPLTALIRAHMAFAEWLASTSEEPGSERLWAGEAGGELAAFIAALLEQAPLLEQIDPAAYPGLLETLLGQQIHRPRFGLHPRLHILSPIEARLQRFDFVILGGLNEGSWPASPEADPWMSRPMRGALGLPTPERAIGQGAHDIYLLCNAPEVLLTRARKVEGSPAIPSRWLVRLETLVAGLGGEQLATMKRDTYYRQALQHLDAPAPMQPLAKPAPAPPLEARPRQLRVTAIDNWLRDPYMIYAKYILKLDTLSPLDEEPDAADFGMLVHDALKRFTDAWPETLPPDALGTLLSCGQQAFAGMIDRPGVACLWWPRFVSMATWFIEEEKNRRGGLKHVLAEIKGKWQMEVDGRPFTLTTTIDRIEITRDSFITIADYKTGFVPGKPELARGLANQLPLEALILQHGVLEGGVSPAAIQALEYWKLSASEGKSEIVPVDISSIAETKERLEGLIRRFDRASEPYAAQEDPSLASRHNDYKHLTRKEEWEAV